MKRKAIALIAIPTMILMGSFTTINADDTKPEQAGVEHQQKKGKHHGPSSEKKFEKMSKKLELTDDQKAQMKALFESQKANRKSASEQRKSLHEAIKALDPTSADYKEKLDIVKQQAGLQAGEKIDSMLANKQKIQAILTPEQFAEFEKMKEKRGGKRDKKNKHKHEQN